MIHKSIAYIYIKVSTAVTKKQLMKDVKEEASYLIEHNDLPTTLVIAPHLKCSFESFHRFFFPKLNEIPEYQGHVQFAEFHPKFQYTAPTAPKDDEESDDVDDIEKLKQRLAEIDSMEEFRNQNRKKIDDLFDDMGLSSSKTMKNNIESNDNLESSLVNKATINQGDDIAKEEFSSNQSEEEKGGHNSLEGGSNNVIEEESNNKSSIKEVKEVANNKEDEDEAWLKEDPEVKYFDKRMEDLEDLLDEQKIHIDLLNVVWEEGFKERAHYTSRSPYPIIHILRHNQLENLRQVNILKLSYNYT
jgi:hypothetical protein